MNVLLMVTTISTLLFYTKATETKECPSYVITEKITGIDKMKEACGKLDGVMASEDLKDSENAAKAQVEINKAYEKALDTKVFFGITSKNIDQDPDQTDNPYVFSDGAKFDAREFPYDWASDTSDHGLGLNCVHLNIEKSSNGVLYEIGCGEEAIALCYVGCPKPADSASEFSRANLPLFALFAAGSVFNVLAALAF